MGLLIKTLLIWFLALAVSAQGAAAATMAFCNANHHGRGVATQPELAAPAKHAHHGSSGTAEHQHPKVEAQADKGASASAVPAKINDASQHKCSACASCCSAGAMLSAMLSMPAPAPIATLFFAVAPSVDPFATDGPDRPPRIVPA